MRWDFGSVLKEIRKSKGLTQNDICGQTLSRTTLSRIENNKEYPSVDSFDSILRQLDMTYAEFDYICHAYQPSERSILITKFESFRGNLLSDVDCQELLEKIEQYLNRHDDIRLQRLEQLLQLILSISKDGADGKTKQLAQALWQEVEKSDTWYLADFRKLNLIMPIIPPEELPAFVDKILDSMDKYRDFKEVRISQFATLFNLSTALLHRQFWSDCLRVLEYAQPVAQESMRLDYLAILNVRLGILKHDNELAQKWIGILRAADMIDMAEQLEKEVAEFGDAAKTQDLFFGEN